MNIYFATKQGKELSDELLQRIKDFNLYHERTGLSDKWQRSEDMFFGKHHGEDGVGAGSIVSEGENNELATYAVNNYRTFIKHALSLTVSQKPSFDVKAKNTDLASIQQTRLAGNIIDSYMSEDNLGLQFFRAAERALVCGKSFVYIFWNTALGRPYTTQDVQKKNGEVVQKVMYEGEPDALMKGPRDVIHDTDTRDWKKTKWVIVRSHDNRWDLVSRYPAASEEISEVSSNDDTESSMTTTKSLKNNSINSDVISCYDFYHEKSDSIKEGRYVKFLSDGTILYDGPMPYAQLPVFRLTPGEMFDTCEGYTDAFDMMGPQEALNTLYSIILTNQNALGVQFVHLPEGCDISESMMKGLAVLRGGAPGTEPKGINLLSSAGEVFKNIDIVQAAQRNLMGLNSSVMGESVPGVKSGIAIGRYQAMAIQYANNFQRSFAELLSNGGTFLFELIKTFAKTERVAAVAGKTNKGAMVSFTGDDLNLIDRVDVDLGNPQSRTASGRIEMADMFYQRGEINARQYMQVVSTGNLDTVFESEESELELIRKENEDMLEGKPVKALIGDSHLAHAKEHKTVINDPQIRTLAAQGDPQATGIVEAVLMHIQEHEQLHATQTPFFGMMSGEPPPPPPMQGPPPPPPGMAPPEEQQDMGNGLPVPPAPPEIPPEAR